MSKYADHLPLHRQAEIYAREGVEIERSTLADWVGGASALLAPLVDRIGQHVLAATKIHADDTPVPVLAPGMGRCATGRLWTYVRDDRPAGSDAPAAVFFRYSPDRKGEHPRKHLKDFRGTLQADGYAGFHHLYEGGHIREAACWAHARRKFYDIHQANESPIAFDALTRIGALYAIETETRGKPPDIRKAARQARTGPLLDQMKSWMSATLSQVSAKSEITAAIRYSLSRWPVLMRYRDDGKLEIGRVEKWRGGGRRGLSVSGPFGRRCPSSSAMTPFPLPARRTGRADLPHPALFHPQQPTPSLTGLSLPDCQPGTATDFPCCTIDHSPCVLPPLPRWMRCACRLLVRAPPSTFLVVMASRYPRRRFEACSVFTHVAARMTRWPPNEAFSGSASTHSLPPESLPVLPGGAFPGRAFTDGSTVPFQGTHNNAAERALRAVAIGRKNYLFAGSDAGGKRAANIYSLIGTAKLNGINPEAYHGRSRAARP